MSKVSNATALSRGSRFYDNTRISSYKTCPRMYYLRHVLGWRREGTALPLVFGLSWHEGMSAMWGKQGTLHELVQAACDAFNACWDDNGLPMTPPLDDKRYDARNPMIAKEMFYNYVSARTNIMRDCTLVADEQPFAVPIPGMDDTYYIGRLDKVIRYNYGTIVVEHKTTSDYKIEGGFKDAFVESWFSDSQVKGYEFAAGLFYNTDVQVWVDAALVHKKVHDAFKFIPVFHQAGLVDEWLDNTVTWIKRIEADTAYPKNEGQCYGKYGACSFCDVCRSFDFNTLPADPPMGYVVDKWEPFSLLNLEKLLKEE